MKYDKHISKEKLKKTFIELIHINSVFPNDLNAQQYILKRFAKANVQAETDEFGNIIAKIEGDPYKPAVMFNTHFDIPEDTPEPDYSVTDDYVIGNGTTILGADAKSGLAVLIETAIEMSKDQNTKRAPVDFVLTRGEEKGLVGASNLDRGKLRANQGLVIDQDGPVSEVVIHAPGWIRFNGTFRGKTVHIREPEDGINALQMAVRAFEAIPMGYTDKTKMVTWNVGIVNGGKAVNSVPAKVSFKAELRSFEIYLLEKEAERIDRTFKEIAEKANGTYESVTNDHFSPYKLGKENEALLKYEMVLDGMGLKPNRLKTFGASDANVFNKQDMQTIAIGSGYYDAHQYYEKADLNDMVELADLLFRYAEA